MVRDVYMACPKYNGICMLQCPKNKMAVIYDNCCVHGAPYYHQTNCPKMAFVLLYPTKQNGFHLW